MEKIFKSKDGNEYRATDCCYTTEGVELAGIYVEAIKPYGEQVDPFIICDYAGSVEDIEDSADFDEICETHIIGRGHDLIDTVEMD